jgi:hypothetical protein
MRSSLRGLAFDHEGCNALYRRLTGPVVQAQNGTAALEIPRAAASEAAHAGRGGACLALVSTDLDLPDEEIVEYVGSTFGWKVKQLLSAEIDYPSGNAATLARVEADAPGCVSIIVVANAGRDPIRAISLFLQRLVVTAGAKPEVILLLVGRREGRSVARVEDGEFQQWRNFQAIHGLRLSLEKWSPA